MLKLSNVEIQKSDRGHIVPVTDRKGNPIRYPMKFTKHYQYQHWSFCICKSNKAPWECSSVNVKRLFLYLDKKASYQWKTEKQYEIERK